jgi:RNA polymerase sigma-70 factor (ECF subfamily)
MHEISTAAMLRPTMSTAADAGEVIGTLFDRHHERLFRLARRMSPDPEEARDLVQEVFLRAARRPRSIPDDAAAGEAWLVTVMVNLCRDRQRRRMVRDRARRSPQPAATEPSNPESAAVARATVQKALRSLTLKRRAVIVLHELEGEPVARIARLLHMAQVTVRWHLSRGRHELANLLLERGDLND